MDLVEAGELKKIVKSHSKYPLSPFELVFGHEVVPRSKIVDSVLLVDTA
jgi:hypothetical protein